MKERTRRLPADRREELLEAALKLAVRQGYRNVTRAEIAAACNVSPSLISHHFGTRTQFQRTLMRYAIKHECAPVVMQGLAEGNAYAKKAPETLRAAAVAAMTADFTKGYVS